jgi:hypothetical protein
MLQKPIIYRRSGVFRLIIAGDLNGLEGCQSHQRLPFGWVEANLVELKFEKLIDLSLEGGSRAHFDIILLAIIMIVYFNTKIIDLKLSKQ